MKKVIFILILLSSFGFVSQTYCQTIEIDNGLTWLINSQNQSGSWGNTATSTNNEYFSTFAVLETLKQLGQDNTAAYQNAIQWLQAEEFLNTAYIAYKISIFANTETDITTDINMLLSYKNNDNAWGGYLKYRSNNFHTTLALQALKAVNYSDQTVIQLAIDYLLSSQNTDGGFGFYQGDDSNVYMTALVSLTLQQFQRTTSIATAINKAASYLIAHQNTDGGFGGSPSTIYETSLAYLALVGDPSTSSGLGQSLLNAINYLSSTQLPNGSWNDDPYSTALALRALANVKPNLSISSNDITFSNPTPTVGETITISATVHNDGPANAPFDRFRAG